MTTATAAPRAGALPEDYRQPEEYFLGRGTRRILQAMAEVILPRNERIQVDCVDDLVNFVDNFVRYLPPMLRMGFPIGIWLFQFLAVVWSGRPVPYTWLSAERKDRYMRNWVYSKLWWKRDMLKGLKGVMLMGFYQHPEVMKSLNYDPVSHVEAVKARRLASYAEEI